MKVEYEQKDEDLRQLEDAAWRRALPRSIAAAVAYGALLSLIPELTPSHLHHPGSGGIVEHVILVGVLFTCPSVFSIYRDRTEIRSHFSKHPLYIGPRVVIVGRESLLYRVSLMDTTFAWPQVGSIEWFPTVCLIKIADFPTYIVVPHRAFANIREANRFFETARCYWKGEPDPDETDWPPPPVVNPQSNLR